MSAWFVLLFAFADPVSWELRRDESYDRRACGDDVAAAARELKVHDITECRVQTYAHGDARIRLATVTYGPVQDCPAGCFQESAQFVARDGHGLPGAHVELPNLADLVRDRIWDEALKHGVPRKNKVGASYDLMGDDGWCPVRADTTLVTDGDAISWRIVYPTTHCDPRIAGPGGERLPYEILVEGPVVVPIIPTTGPVDFSGLRITVEEHRR